jgi:hypothetical protein
MYQFCIVMRYLEVGFLVYMYKARSGRSLNKNFDCGRHFYNYSCACWRDCFGDEQIIIMSKLFFFKEPTQLLQSCIVIRANDELCGT